MEKLIIKSKSLVAQTQVKFIRYIHDSIDWNARLVAIVGARGVGKTTLVLQHILLRDKPNTSLYVSADDLYFSSHRLIDLAYQFYQLGGERLYIDEIHRYAGWSQEIKNIYDSLPGLSVVYTGSSIWDLEKGGSDLSRRKLQYRLYGLSFREYLELACDIKMPVATIENIVKGEVSLSSEYRPLQLFKEYLRIGYYPFFSESGYFQRLNAVINNTLETDIPEFASFSISTARKLKQLVYIIAQSTPFKPNVSKIARDINVSRNSIEDIFVYLEKTGLIARLRTDVKGISALGKVDKIYLDNTNLAYAISETTPDVGNIRETFFFEATRAVQNVAASKVSGFTVGDMTFEVGGSNKKSRQIAGVSNAYLVKDDIEYGAMHILPLWNFGMLY